MIKIKYLFISISIFCLCESCIDPFKIDLKNDLRILTVDGLISTEPGIHEVRLTLSSKFDNQLSGSTITVNDARVSIIDSDGIEVILKEYAPSTVIYYDSQINEWITLNSIRKTGIYQTPSDFFVKLNKEYKLLVETKEGIIYESTFEYARKVPQIDSIRSRPFRVATKNPLLDQTGMMIDAFFKDDPSESNYYLWKPVDGMGVLVTYPELYTIPRTAIVCGGCAAPKACCKECFLPETRMKGVFEISNDRLFNGINTLIPAVFLPEDGFRFMKRYRLTVNQYSISEQGYNFLNLVKQQLEIEGSVFDPLPSNIIGNISNLTNPEEQVLGYFFVSDVSSKTIYIDREDLPFDYRKPTAKVYDDCREFFSFTGSFIGTERIGTTPPPDWKWIDN